MKIGIITPWWSHSNYGQILQAYAMQQMLLSEGHEAFTIKYNGAADMAIKKYENDGLPKYLYAYIRQYFKYLLFDYYPLFDKRKFNIFKKEKIRFSSLYLTYEKLVAKHPKADAYIVGSDQVWGPWYRINPYLLSFGEKNTKRIAYAGSFGRETLSNNEIENIAPLLKEFDYIGVREKSGIDVCKLIGDDRAVWVPDPTILLKKSEWQKIIKKSKYFETNKKKIFVYIIGSDNNIEIKKTVDLLSENEDASVLYISDSADPLQNIYPSIQEWLGLIQEADFIVTNSFHGTVFSLLFNKEFITLTRTGEKTKSMNTRIISLLERMKLSSRLVERIDKNYILSIKNNPINWAYIDCELDLWRKEGEEFLICSIGN
ncbi:MAG: polysaccharide pyruvyl transferase family protein [Chlorobium sp.]|nr:polysaccharide pyruvyl transferase family protein [Chlorobium sp.]